MKEGKRKQPAESTKKIKKAKKHDSIQNLKAIKEEIREDTDTHFYKHEKYEDSPKRLKQDTPI
jgi:hypothetical protein